MSDTFFTTNNKVLLSRTKDLPAIQCAQKKAKKQVYDEKKTVEANKLAFGDEIGSITNTATSMIEVQAGFPKDSSEYKELEYRIQCSQSLQQSSIDSAKGIIYIPMPEIWKNKSACSIKKNDSEDIIRLKEFYSRVCAYRKPYFFIYRYQEEKKNYIKFKKSYEVNSIWKFEEKLDVLLDQYALDKTVLDEKQIEFIESYYKYMPVGTNPCTVNRICWFFEDAFENIKLLNKNKTFDHSIYKCPDVDETSSEYTKLKKELQMKLKDYSRMCAEVYSEHSYDANIEVRNDKIANMRDTIITECLSLCSDKRMLCNALVDVYYTSDNSKQLCWDVCGDVIFKNLLHRNDYKLEYPERSSDGDIEFNGFKFKINTVEWRIDYETNCK